MIIHLAAFVKKYRKTLFDLSAYPFENYLRKLKLGEMVKSAHHPAVQAARRIYEMTVFLTFDEKVEKKIGLFHRLVHTNPDSQVFQVYQTDNFYFDNSIANRFCQIKGKRLMMIHYFLKINDDETHVHGVFLDDVEPLYTIPCSSYYLNTMIAHVLDSHINPSTTLDHVNIKEISGKYFCIPTDLQSRYAFVKLLHYVSFVSHLRFLIVL